jgi:VCBS repeat-containing protein
VPTKVSDDVATSGDYRIGHVHNYVPGGPVAHADTAVLAMHADEISGNLLANDTDGRNDPLTLAEFAGQTGDGTLSVAGKYGVVSVDANGNFVYHMNPGAMDGAIHSTTDVFTYLVTDGGNQSAAQLTVDLLPRMEVRPIAGNDAVAVGQDGSIGGNVLSNDHDANHDTLYLRWMGGERVTGSAETTIEGKYGTLTVDQHGDYIYHADASDAAASGVLHDTFLYKISDSQLQDTANLSVSIDPHTLTPDWGLGFHI